MLNSIFSDTVVNIDIVAVLISYLVSIVLGLVIAITYKFTSKYNKDFLITITILPILVETVILLVSGNLGMSIAVAGTFALVRFRSIPGTSKEIATVFFAMTVGLANGVGYLVFSVILTVLGVLVLIIFSKTSIFNKNKCERHLRITIPEDLDYTKVFDDVLSKYTNSNELIEVKTTALGSMFELKYIVFLKNNINQKEFIDDLRVKNGNLKIILTEPIDGSEF